MYCRKPTLTFFSLLPLVGLLLGGCAKPPIYSAADFQAPPRIIKETTPMTLPKPKVAATYGFGNDPAVLSAYNTFTKTGVAKSVNAKGFKVFAYDAYSQPIVACAPLRLCIVQLERGESVNNIDVGDRIHWKVSTAIMGDKHDGSVQVVVKPTLAGIATDMAITTDKRTYNIGLVSKQGESTHVVNFYYPEETLNQAVAKAKIDHDDPARAAVVSRATHVSVNHLNFNYDVDGDYPIWRPTRVFDDGNKTFFQLSPRVAHDELPVLYLLGESGQELVTWRYQRPYFVLDGLFKQAVLVSGKGSDQVRVTITNNQQAG